MSGIRSIAAVLLVCALPAFAAKPPLSEEAKTERNRAATAEFFAGAIRELHIELGDEQMKSLRDEPRRYVQGALNEEGNSIKGVAMKLKGASGSFKPIDERPCFTIHLDKFKGAARFHGMRKFHLNNANEDPSFLRQIVSGEMMRAAGVPALRATHVLLSLNARDLGLYVLTESYTEDFLAEHFSDPTGDVYESGFVKDIDEELQKDEGDKKDFRAIEQLLAACRTEDAAERWKGLRAILDVERFASFLAMEALLGVADGYDFYRNNYRIYHDPRTRRLSFIPHGLDQPLGELEFPIQKQPESIVGRAFVSCPEGRALYRERVAKLHARVFTKHDWPARTGELARKVQTALGAKKAKPLAEPMAELRRLVAGRTQWIAQQLADMPEPLEFDKTGVARIAKGWTTKQEGGAKFERAAASLRIVAEGGTQASWRAPLQLAGGRYRFEARVKTVGVAEGEGVCLRISGSDPAGGWIAGDAPWKPAHYEFEVGEDGGDVVLVAELRAGRGEAWFDAMQLVRVK